MEWEAPAIVLASRAYGEGGALICVLSEQHGAWRGLVRGGTSRAQAATWQRGNLVAGRWVARLSDQLGSLSGELVHAGAAEAMDDPLALAVLSAACAVAEGALPEREPHSGVFGGMVRLVAGLGAGAAHVAALVRWEVGLLAALGYGLDLERCALSGATDELAFVSPRSGRAVALGSAGKWAERLLPLPGFVREGGDGDAAAWRDGLRLTGHFLARDVFGAQHRPVPEARSLLSDRVERLASEVDR